MCFSLTGRLHTRLIMLVPLLVLTTLFVVVSGKPDYWILLALMTVVGIGLELGLYGWLINYQPRWLTLCLAVMEFFILKWITEWPYPFEIRLRTRQALLFYLLAWLIIWLMLEIFLPLWSSRWAEDGGEFRPLSTIRAKPQYMPLQDFFIRRRIFLNAVGMLIIVSLPWLVTALRLPAGQHFTGLLVGESGHLRALGQAVAVVRDNFPTSLAGLIGWIAHMGRWPVLNIYFVFWGLAGMGWLVGFQLLFNPVSVKNLPALLLACLPLLFLPVPWIMVAAVCAWLSVFLHLDKWVILLLKPLSKPLALAAVLIWLFIWMRAPTAPLSALDESVWQATAWLRQQRTEITVAVPPSLVAVVAAFSGQKTVPTGEPSTYQIIFVVPAKIEPVLFRHGNLYLLNNP